jgi:hypothetical protein
MTSMGPATERWDGAGAADGLGPKALGKNGRMVLSTSIGAFLVELLLGMLVAMWIVELIVLGIWGLILSLFRLLVPPQESSMEVFGPASTEEDGTSADLWVYQSQ